MTSKTKRKEEQRRRRHRRIRSKIFGTPARPRLVVHRSNKNMQAQLVDDTTERVLLGASTLSPELAELREKEGTTKTELSRAAGELLAERAKEAGIERVVFDRGGYKFHGRVAAFAEGAREGGLEF